MGCGDFWKSRSFPLISAYLSRVVGRDVGVNGGDWVGFGGDNRGFGGPVGGFGGATFGVGHWTVRDWATGRIWAVGWFNGTDGWRAGARGKCQWMVVRKHPPRATEQTEQVVAAGDVPSWGNVSSRTFGILQMVRIGAVLDGGEDGMTVSASIRYPPLLRTCTSPWSSQKYPFSVRRTQPSPA